MTKVIKVWCEYDFNGPFGGNNNEAAIVVPEHYADGQIEAKVSAYLSKATGESEKNLEGLYGWQHIELPVLK